MPNATAKSSARERLLAAADELFYREGVQTVGIDRVIEHAGVAKASLYNNFASKEELVIAYLASRHASTSERITRALTRYRTPREQLLGVFDAQGELFTDPGFNGCAFVSASAGSSSLKGAGSGFAAQNSACSEICSGVRNKIVPRSRRSIFIPDSSCSS